MSINLTLFNAGVDYFAQLEVNKEAQGNLTWKLYVNNHTPVVTDTGAAYTICTLAGYADFTTLGATWTGSSSAGLATYTYANNTYTFNAYAGGTTIYGIVLFSSGGTALGAALLDVPFAVPIGGGTLTLGLTETVQKYP